MSVPSVAEIFQALLRRNRERRLSFLRRPVVRDFSPTSGPVGTVVTIRGSRFALRPMPPGGYGVAAVAFNGTPSVAVAIVGDGELRATVPAGATTGPITVENQAGSTSSSASFAVV